MEQLVVRKFVPEIDGLRCYGFLLVFVGHVLYTRFPVAWVGVDIFFVMSGFLITRILLHDKGRPGYFKNFYARRLVRVFPLYYLVLVLVFYVLPVVLPDDPGVRHAAWEQKYYFLYVQNLALNMLRENHNVYLGHLWSLAIEEQYYLVWPLVVFLLGPRALAGTCAGILVFCPVLRYLLYARGVHQHAWLLEGTFLQQGLSQWEVYKNTFLRLDGVALGSLMAVVVHHRWLTMRAFRRVAGLLSLTVLPAAFVLIWRTGFFPLTLPPGPERWEVVWIYPLVAFGFAGLIGVLLVVRHVAIRWLFANPLVTYVGKISYGLYVFHFPIHTILFLHLLPPQYDRVPDWVRHNAYATYFVLTFAAAILSWHLFESPLLRLKKHFQTR